MASHGLWLEGGLNEVLVVGGLLALVFVRAGRGGDWWVFGGWGFGWWIGGVLGVWFDALFACTRFEGGSAGNLEEV